MNATKKIICIFLVIITTFAMSACKSVDPNEDFGIEDTEGISRENAAEVYGEVTALEGNMDFYGDGSSALFYDFTGLNTFKTKNSEYNLLNIKVGDLANVMFDELEKPDFLSYPLQEEGELIEDIQVVAHYFVEYERIFFEFSINQNGGDITEITFSNISFLGDNVSSGLVGEFADTENGDIMRFDPKGMLTMLSADGLVIAQGQYVVYDDYLGINVLTGENVREEYVFEMTKNEEDILLLNLSANGQNTETGEVVDMGFTANHTRVIKPVDEAQFKDVKIEKAYKTEITQNHEIDEAREVVSEYQEIENVVTSKTQIDYMGERHEVVVIGVTEPTGGFFTTYAISEDGEVYLLDIFNIENYRISDSYWTKIS